MVFEMSTSSSNPAVNDALDLIETDLQEAVVTAIERIDAVLASKPQDVRALRTRASFLHELAAQIDKNREQRSNSRIGF